MKILGRSDQAIFATSKHLLYILEKFTRAHEMVMFLCPKAKIAIEYSYCMRFDKLKCLHIPAFEILWIERIIKQSPQRMIYDWKYTDDSNFRITYMSTKAYD